MRSRGVEIYRQKIRGFSQDFDIDRLKEGWKKCVSDGVELFGAHPVVAHAHKEHANFLHMGDFKECLESFKLASENLRSNSHGLQRARVLKNWGGVLLKHGHEDGVLKLNEALEIVRGKFNDKTLEDEIEEALETGGRRRCFQGPNCPHNKNGRCWFYHDKTTSRIEPLMRLSAAQSNL